MKGWRYESHRHSLAAKGISTSKRVSFAKEGWLTGAIRAGLKKGEITERARYSAPAEKLYSEREGLKYAALSPFEQAKVSDLVEKSKIRGDTGRVAYIKDYVASAVPTDLEDARFGSEEIRRAAIYRNKEKLKRVAVDLAQDPSISSLMADLKIVRIDEDGNWNFVDSTSEDVLMSILSSQAGIPSQFGDEHVLTETDAKLALAQQNVNLSNLLRTMEARQVSEATTQTRLAAESRKQQEERESQLASEKREELIRTKAEVEQAKAASSGGLRGSKSRIHGRDDEDKDLGPALTSDEPDISYSTNWGQ